MVCLIRNDTNATTGSSTTPVIARSVATKQSTYQYWNLFCSTSVKARVESKELVCFLREHTL